MRKGFTLIELLIVVAIIAILAAIAVPNFLEAQVRSKVSRTKADMRSIVTALESYRVDHNKYIPDGQAATPALKYLGTTQDVAHLSNMLSTPVAYITDANPVDVFNTDKTLGYDRTFRYVNFEEIYAKSDIQARRDAWDKAYSKVYGAFMMLSNGPDKKASITDPAYSPAAYWVVTKYDSTNGTISTGDIVTSQKGMDPQYPSNANAFQ